MRIDCRRFAGLVLVVPLLAGCTLGPDFTAPDPAAPASWLGDHPNAAASVPVAGPIRQRWWDAFGDPELTRLIGRLADGNLDLRAATARIAESRAQLRVTSADAYPQVNGNASYTREQVSNKGVVSLIGGGGAAQASNGLAGRQSGIPAGIGGGNLPAFDLWQYGFDASWELDLWGRIRRTEESAAATLDASTASKDDTMLSVTAELANDYLQMRGTQERLRITRENLASAEDSVKLTRERSHNGFATELDVADAQTQAEDTAALIPPLEQQERRLINAIGLLLGELPGALRVELAAAQPIPPVPPLVPVGLPSELARRRPDIRQAEAQLHAATAGIGAAEADFYPRVTLSGSASLQALQFKDLGNWDSHGFGIGPGISIPIFEGGRLHGTLALREAQQQEAAATYQHTVLAAFRDVDDALTAYGAEQRRRDRLVASVAAARRAFELATTRYRQGLADYLQVLTAQRSVLAEEQQLADSTATIDTDLVALCKALGGGWEA